MKYFTRRTLTWEMYPMWKRYFHRLKGGFIARFGPFSVCYYVHKTKRIEA